MLIAFIILAVVSAAVMIFCGIVNLFDLEYYVPVIDTHDTGWYALVTLIFSSIATVATVVINASLGQI